MNFLAISGSLRAASTNTALLRAIKDAAAPRHAVTLYDGLAGLPIFNPDSEGEATPPAVAALGAAIRASDGLLIASPEYAHGIPGGLKNALDWMVSRDEVPFKPVMFVHASPRSLVARAALKEVVATMSMRIIDQAELTVELLGRTPEAMAGILDAPESMRRIADALAAFAGAIEAPRSPG